MRGVHPDDDDRPRGVRIVRGTLASGFGQCVQIGSQIVLVPAFLLAWGVDQYGHWLTATAAVTFLALLDGGVPAHVFNLLVGARAREEERRFRQILDTLWGAALVMSIGALACVVLLLVSPLGAFFGDQAVGLGQARLTIGLLAAAVLLQIPTGVLVGLHRVAGRFARSETWSAFQRLLGTGTVLAVLFLGGDPLAVACGMLGAQLIGLAWIAHDLRRIAPEVVPGVREARPVMLRGFLLPGAGFLGVQAIELLQVQGAVFLAGALVSVAVVPVLTSLRTLTHFGLHLAACFTNPVWPESTALHSVGDRRGLERMLALTEKIVLTAIAGFSAWLLVVSEPIITVWTGGEISFDRLLLVALLLRLGAKALHLPSTMLLLSWSRLGPVVAWGLGGQILGLAIGAALALGGHGLAAIILGQTIGTLLTSSWALPLAVRREVAGGHAVRALVTPRMLLVCGGLVGAGVGLDALLREAAPWQAFGLATVALSLLGPGLLWCVWLDEEERARVKRAVGAVPRFASEAREGAAS